jgi:hypothetical protein
MPTTFPATLSREITNISHPKFYTCRNLIGNVTTWWWRSTVAETCSCSINNNTFNKTCCVRRPFHTYIKYCTFLVITSAIIWNCIINIAKCTEYMWSRVCYNERMLQRTRRDTVGRRSTRVRMTCRSFPIWLERQSSSLLSFVSFSDQFSSVICFSNWNVQRLKVK